MLDIAAPPLPALVVATTETPSAPEIVPEFVMPPMKVDTVIVPSLVPVPPTNIPECAAEIVPELAMPPVKVDTVIETPPVAPPPTTMPAPSVVEIWPELSMPPENLGMI